MGNYGNPNGQQKRGRRGPRGLYTAGQINGAEVDPPSVYSPVQRIPKGRPTKTPKGGPPNWDVGRDRNVANRSTASPQVKGRLMETIAGVALFCRSRVFGATTGLGKRSPGIATLSSRVPCFGYHQVQIRVGSGLPGANMERGAEGQPKWPLHWPQMGHPTIQRRSQGQAERAETLGPPIEAAEPKGSRPKPELPPSRQSHRPGPAPFGWRGTGGHLSGAIWWNGALECEETEGGWAGGRMEGGMRRCFWPPPTLPEASTTKPRAPASCLGDGDARNPAPIVGRRRGRGARIEHYAHQGPPNIGQSDPRGLEPAKALRSFGLAWRGTT